MKRIYLLVLLLVYTIGTYSQNTSLAVGTIPGNFDVSSTGAARYIIPIECPKGFAGLQPNIALVYNSQSGDNIAGWGWGISGLSSIGKGVKNIFSDNSVTGFDILKQDKYILDGKNLVLVSGTYGGNGAVYKFENDDFTRITSIGQNTSPQYPLSFKVETKGGNVIEYTKRAFPRNYDMYAVAPGPYQWLPEKITDTNGNFIKFTYYNYPEYPSQILVSKIEYAGNVDDNKSYASIDFTYSKKSKNRLHYMNAYLVEDYALLSDITVSSKTEISAQVLRKYKLFYKTENEECFLTEVQLENAENERINSTIFTWGNDNKELKINEFRMPSAVEPLNSYFTTADIDGDGKSDLVNLYYDGVLNKEMIEVYKIKKENGELSRAERIAWYDPGVNYMDRNWKILKGHFLFVNTNEGGQAKRIVLPRFVNSSGGSNYMNFDIYTSLTQVTRITQKCNYTDEMTIYANGDINNDGCDEIISLERFEQLQNPSNVCRIFYLNKLPNSGYSHYINIPSSIYKPDKLFIEDFDGDGLKDLCIVAENGTYFLKNMGGTPDNGVIRPSFSLVKTFGIYSNYSEIQLGDFNGNGLPDFIVNEHCNSTWKVIRNLGNFMFLTIEQPNITAVEEDFTSGNDDKDECIVVDFDHDGKSDLIIVESVYNKRHSWGTYDRTEIKLYHSNGSKFDVAHSITVYDEGYLYSRNHTVGDFDGDGREELFTYGSDIYNGNKKNRNSFFYTCFNTNFEHKRIKSITDGFGNKTEITYQPLSCDKTEDGQTYYSREGSRYYPLVNVSAPLYCVKSVKTPLGETLSYTYKDATSHVTGKGFLGFGEISTKNNRTLHASTSSTNLDWSYYLPAQQTVLVTDGNKNKISESFVSFTNLKVGNTYQSRPLKTKETDFLKNLVKTTDYLSYDNYNNLLQEKRTYADGITTTIDYTYESPITSPYLIGQLSGSTAVHSYNGDVWTEKEVIAYNPQHLPKSKINYIGRYGNKKTGETAWTYNNRGSVLTEKSSRYSSANFLGTTYTYDLQEHVVNSKDEFNHNTEYSQYNKWGEAEKVTDFIGNSTTYSFDNWGRKVSATHPDGVAESTSVTWGSYLGLYIENRITTGKPKSQFFYDSFGREVRNINMRFDGAPMYTDRQYDANGNLKKTSLPYKGGYSVCWNNYEYDTYNRPISITDSSGKVISWSYSGNTVSERKDGITINKVYDALGRLVKVTDPAGTITYSYNANGQLRSAVAPGNVTTSFEYDDFGRRIKIVDPSAGTKTYTYDEEGNVNSETDANGKEIRMTYDKYGQMVQKEYVGQLITDYMYVDNILVAKRSNNRTQKEYTYDEFLRVSQEKISACGKYLIKKYTFQDGNVSEVNYRYNLGGGDIVLGSEQYIYSLGNLAGIRWNNTQTIWTLNEESSSGLVSSCTTGNLKHDYSYDIAGRPTGQTVKYNKKEIQNFSYNFNPQTENLSWRKDNTRNITENFGYDGLNRLTSFGGQTATYNGKGNITNLSEIGTFEYDTSGKPYAVSAVTPVAGSEFPTHLNTVTYNSMMRPEGIFQSISNASFTYNSDGERVSMFIAYGSRMLPSGIYYYYIGDRYESIQYYGSSEQKEIFYIGGDAYSAPAVLVKDFGSDNWKLHYICRDYLGSITHIVDESGDIEQELSYDAWGNLRDPETHKLCAFDRKKGFLELFLGRGYTGHEHLSRFGLINTNARLYDPLLGRFLSPDPYVQTPENSQNFNRYSYCLNNPLLYTDPTGEYAVIDDVIAAVFGGFVNLICNWNNLGADNIWKSVGKGAAAFGAGAIGGVGGLYPEFGGWAWGGATVGATNSWLSGSKGWDIVAGAGIGVITGYAGGVAAEYGGQYVSNLVINGTNITSPVLQRTVAGSIGGAVSGYASGFTGGLIMTGDTGKANQYGLRGLGIGSAVGAITGTVTGYKYAKDQGLGLWSGDDLLLGELNTKYDYSLDPYGDNVTLYRGTTGSEGNGKPMFMTDNAEYAASYVKNGGQVVKVTISRFTFKQLQSAGQIKPLNGMHKGLNGQEYEIVPKIATDFIKLFKY